MSVIVLDRQHVGKPGRQIGDLGAQRPADLAASHLDDLQLSRLNSSEAIYTAIYGLAAELRLRTLLPQHDLVVMSHGSYRQRHAWVNENLGRDAVVYVALHLNAGSPARGREYSTCMYDFRSPAGRGDRLAECVSQRLSALPQIGGNRRIWDTDHRKPGAGWKRNAHSCIKGVRHAVGLVYEPIFIDGPRHQELLNAAGMQLLGHALADGIHDYLTQTEAVS